MEIDIRWIITMLFALTNVLLCMKLARDANTHKLFDNQEITRLKIELRVEKNSHDWWRSQAQEWKERYDQLAERVVPPKPEKPQDNVDPGLDSGQPGS